MNTLVDVLEKDWDRQLFARDKGLASMLGWRLAYHTLRSKGSQSGFPDRVLVRERVIFAELKGEKGVVSPAQREWLDGLAKAGAEVYVWRPSDLDEIAAILQARGRPGRVWRSMWIAERGRADELHFACTIDESAGLAPP